MRLNSRAEWCRFGFELAAAILALLAAWFWYRSAAAPLPPELTYLDGAPATDPFFKALQDGVSLNKTGAAFAASSALCAAFATIIGLLKRSR